MYDAIIVGSGPAGYTACIYLSRAGLKKLLGSGKKGRKKIENEKYRVSITLIASQTSHLSVAALKIEY